MSKALTEYAVRYALTTEVPVDFIECPVCSDVRRVVGNRSRLAVVLTCGAVVIVTDSGMTRWFNFEEHKEEE